MRLDRLLKPRGPLHSVITQHCLVSLSFFPDPNSRKRKEDLLSDLPWQRHGASKVPLIEVIRWTLGRLFSDGENRSRQR
jgi:hypothetical protein